MPRLVDLPVEVLQIICEHLLDPDDDQGVDLCNARLVSRQWCRVASTVAHRRVVVCGLPHIKQFLAAIIADTKRARGPPSNSSIAKTTFYAPDIRALVLYEPKSLRAWEKNRTRLTTSVVNALRAALPRLVGLRRLVLFLFVWPMPDVQRVFAKCKALEALEVRQVRAMQTSIHATMPDGEVAVISNPYATREHFPTEHYQFPGIVLSLATLRHLHLQAYGPYGGFENAWDQNFRHWCFAYLGDMSSLRTLVLNCCCSNVPDLGVHALVLKHTWPELRHVALVGLHLDPAAFWRFLARHPHLEHVDWREPAWQGAHEHWTSPPPRALALPNLRSVFFLPARPSDPLVAEALSGLLGATQRPLEMLMVSSPVAAKALSRSGGAEARYLRSLWLDVHGELESELTDFLQRATQLLELELSFEDLRIPLEHELAAILAPAGTLQKLSVTVAFDLAQVTPDDAVTNELLESCILHCPSLRCVVVYWICRSEKHAWDRSYPVRTFFSKRTAVWSDCDGNGLLRRVERTERQEPVEWDVARPGCPSFSTIPSWY